jgi:hypothetical protein
MTCICDDKYCEFCDPTWPDGLIPVRGEVGPDECADYPTHPATIAADAADFQRGDCVQHLRTKKPWTVVKLDPFTIWDYYRGRRKANPRNFRLLYRPVMGYGL